VKLVELKLSNLPELETYNPYAGAAGMLLHINEKFIMRKFKSSFLS
jgi:hypothetical protein